MVYHSSQSQEILTWLFSISWLTKKLALFRVKKSNFEFKYQLGSNASKVWIWCEFAARCGIYILAIKSWLLQSRGNFFCTGSKIAWAEIRKVLPPFLSWQEQGGFYNPKGRTMYIKMTSLGIVSENIPRKSNSTRKIFFEKSE